MTRCIRQRLVGFVLATVGGLGPEDFVVATGVQYSVRELIAWTAAELSITLRFEGHGVDEIGIVAGIECDKAQPLKVGDCVVAVDPRYFRPAEVETLLGDPSKAMHKLGWGPRSRPADVRRDESHGSGRRAPPQVAEGTWSRCTGGP